MRPDDKREFVQWLRLMADELEGELKAQEAKAAEKGAPKPTPTPAPDPGLEAFLG